MAGTPAQNGNSAAGNSDFSRKAMELAAGMWTTPQAHDLTARGSAQVPTSNAGNACLATDAMQWSTPRASAAEKGGPNQSFGAGGIPLPAQAAKWTTPSASDGTRGGTGITEGMSGSSLTQNVAQWPTPQSRDLRMGDNPESPRQLRKMDQGWSQNLNDLAETWPTPSAMSRH